jgi:hypothetical protein
MRKIWELGRAEDEGGLGMRKIWNEGELRMREGCG